MKQKAIDQIDEQLEHAWQLLEDLKSELDVFEKDVESEAKAIEKEIREHEESQGKGRGGWLGLMARRH